MRSSLWTVGAVRAATAAAGMFALAAVFTRAGVGVVTGLVGYAACCGLVALALPPAYAALCGLTGWALLTGFVVNAGGQLTFDPGDLRHLIVLVALSAAVSVLRPPRGGRRHGSRV